MNRILIIDGHNLLFQMFFGMPTKIIGARGKAIHGVIGFIGALNRLAENLSPSHQQLPHRYNYPSYRHLHTAIITRIEYVSIFSFRN